MSSRTPKEMRDDALVWSRAGYPAVAVGRYRDAADQIERLTAVIREARDALVNLGDGEALEILDKAIQPTQPTDHR